MRKRSVLILTLLIAGLSLSWAESDAHNRSVEDVELEIRASLGLGADEAIKPDRVPDELLVSLGDAVMGSYIDDPQRHEWMDRMMGGEGSESLDSAHQWMAYRYLNGGYGMESGMMGAGTMGGMMGGWGLMGNPDMMYDSSPYGSPEDILRRRYASGDISRGEYRRMLKELE